MKKTAFIVIVIVLLLIINGLLHSIFDLWQKQALVTSAKQELDTQRLKNAKLKGELSYVKGQQFVDETARNNLFLEKPGEQRVIISSDLAPSENKSSVQKQFSNWQKWLNLFWQPGR